MAVAGRPDTKSSSRQRWGFDHDDRLVIVANVLRQARPADRSVSGQRCGHNVNVTIPVWPPRTPAAAGPLLWAGERLLVLRPTYRPTWTLPSGCLEDGESPLTACLREVREETGFERSIGVLRCVDHRSPGPGVGGLRFLFDLGALAAHEEQSLRLPAEEIAEYRLVTPEDACALLDDAQGRRLTAVLLAPPGGSTWRTARPPKRGRRCPREGRPLPEPPP